MTGILLKHGISKDLLTEKQLLKFNTVVQEIAKEDFHSFEFFLEKWDKTLAKRRKLLMELNEKTVLTLNRLVDSVNITLPNSDTAILSSFAKNFSKKELTSNHDAITVALYRAISDLDTIVYSYTRISAKTNSDLLLEGEIRRIAILEFAKDEKRFSERLDEVCTQRYAEDIASARALRLLDCKRDFSLFYERLDTSFGRVIGKDASIGEYFSSAREFLNYVYLELSNQKTYYKELQ